MKTLVSRIGTLVTVGVLLSATTSSCGGGSATTGSRRTTRQGTRAAQLSGEATEAFAEAVRMYQTAEQQGWNEDRCEDVADAFKTAAEEQEGGRFHEAWFNRGLALNHCGKTEEATDAFRRALQAKANYGPPRVMLGVFAYRRGNVGEAFRMFEQAIRDDAQNVEAYVNMAMLQRERGQGRDMADAQLNIRRALAVDAQFLPAFNQLALLYVQQAAEERTKLQLASVVCKQATQINANFAPIWNTWGLINLQEGNIIGAMAKFEKAFQLNPKFFEAYMNFGAITLSFRGYEDAKTAFTKAGQLNRRSYEAHIGLGVALRGLDQPPEAKKEYEAAREIDQARPDAYFNLGVLYQDYMSGSIEEFSTAKQYFAEFLQRAQGRQPLQANIQAAQQRIKNIDETVAALREGMELARIAEEQQRRQEEEDRRLAEQAAAEAADGGAAAPDAGAE